MQTPTPLARDLIQEISVILEKHGHTSPTLWADKLPKEAFESEDENFRRFHINQFWRQSLGRLDIYQNRNTMHERYCLIEDGSTEDWLRLFDTIVAKTIVEFRLEYPPH